MTIIETEPPEPLGACRVCGGPSWRADESGPVHLCCSRLPDGETVCVPCRASTAAEADWQKRGKKRSEKMAEIRTRQATQETS